MLREIKNPRQVEGEGWRRWFTDEYFDLIVWYHPEKTLQGFQLCYDRGHEERALTWRAGEGYSHKRVDDGDVTGRVKMTPVLVPNGVLDSEEIAERFAQE